MHIVKGNTGHAQLRNWAQLRPTYYMDIKWQRDVIMDLSFSMVMRKRVTVRGTKSLVYVTSVQSTTSSTDQVS